MPKGSSKRFHPFLPFAPFERGNTFNIERKRKVATHTQLVARSASLFDWSNSSSERCTPTTGISTREFFYSYIRRSIAFRTKRDPAVDGYTAIADTIAARSWKVGKFLWPGRMDVSLSAGIHLSLPRLPFCPKCEGTLLSSLFSRSRTSEKN